VPYSVYGTTLGGVVIDWKYLMEAARTQATISGQRTKVVATLASPRMAKYLGSKYLYVIQSPENKWDTRCGFTESNFKPCIKRVGYGHGTYHLSRDREKDTFVWWTPTDLNGNPTRREAVSYAYCRATVEEVKEMGLL
jgi:hypothetical protein